MPQRKPDRAIIIVSGYGTIKAKVGDMREDKKRRDSKEKEILQTSGTIDGIVDNDGDVLLKKRYVVLPVHGHYGAKRLVWVLQPRAGTLDFSLGKLKASILRETLFKTSVAILGLEYTHSGAPEIMALKA
ncbi:hypothetical protein L218DRAFT_949937 [Marasmius fiardii PR-910]|nr:hypothetical protein L218DRAFT_949937 [Marasmius fiardii PR-910]